MKWCCCLLILVARVALAGDDVPVKIDRAWVRAVPPSVPDSAAYMRLQNTGDTPLRLTGATTPLAGIAMPMITTHKMVQGVEALGMKGVDYLEIPAHGELRLQPGGNHLMLMNLTRHPKTGEQVTVTLEFEPGHRKLTVTVPALMDAMP